MKKLLFVLLAMSVFGSQAFAGGRGVGLNDTDALALTGVITVAPSMLIGGVMTCVIGAPACVPVLIAGVATGGAGGIYFLVENLNLVETSPLMEQAYAGHGEMIESIANVYGVSVEAVAAGLIDASKKLESNK